MLGFYIQEEIELTKHEYVTFKASTETKAIEELRSEINILVNSATSDILSDVHALLTERK